MKLIVNDILLNHKESGHPHGVPIIFIHGFPFNISMWKFQMDHLPNKFRTIAYDVRGLGSSDLGTGERSMDKNADDLIGLLDDLKIEKAVVCGLSMGGYIALRAVEKYPERFMGLILCDTKSESDSPEARQKRYDSINKIEQDGLDEFADTFLKGALGKKTLLDNPSLVAALKNMILENHSEGIAAAQVSMANRTDTTGVLSKLNIPVLVMVGEQDEITPVATAEKLQNNIKGARLSIVPGAGHLSNIENPEAFNKALVEFLEQF